MPTDLRSLPVEPRNLLSKEIHVSSPKHQSTILSDDINNVAAVSKEKMMTLTTDLHSTQESRAVSLSKLTVDYPEIPRPNSATFWVPERKSNRFSQTTGVSSRSVSILHPSANNISKNNGNTNRLTINRMAPIEEITNGTWKTKKQIHSLVAEKSKLDCSNGELYGQPDARTTKLTRWEPSTDISRYDLMMSSGDGHRTPTTSPWGNKVQTALSSSNHTPVPSPESVRRSPYPSLFEVLHHCNILRIVLDPNIPNESRQLGLHLELTKFPLDDIQRANSIQRWQSQQQNTGSKDTVASFGSDGQYGPRGPKPRIIPREGSAFRAFEDRRLDDAPDVIAIKRIDPDSPAGIHGGLTVGTLLLEINGKTLLRTNESDDPVSASEELLKFAEEQLQLASRAGLSGEAPPVRITAARYHNRFGTDNKVNVPERPNLVSRRFIIGKPITETDYGNPVISWRKTPSSVNSSDVQSVQSSRAKSEVSLRTESAASNTHEGVHTPSEISQLGSTHSSSRGPSAGNPDNRNGLVWFPSSRLSFPQGSATSETSSDTTGKNGRES